MLFWCAWKLSGIKVCTLWNCSDSLRPCIGPSKLFKWKLHRREKHSWLCQSFSFFFHSLKRLPVRIHLVFLVCFFESILFWMKTNPVAFFVSMCYQNVIFSPNKSFIAFFFSNCQPSPHNVCLLLICLYSFYVCTNTCIVEEKTVLFLFVD